MLTLTGTVLNVFEAVDVIALIKGGTYDDLGLTVGDALLKRSEVRSRHQITVFVPGLNKRRTSRVSLPARLTTTCRLFTTLFVDRASIASSSLMMRISWLALLR